MKTTKPLLAFILLFAGICIQLNAKNLFVTSTANSGAGSLRDQIAAADPGDRIVFASGTFGIPIVLTTGQIVIDKELIIAGSGIQSTIIDGNGTSRIFNIISGHVTIHDLTIQNGALDFLFDSGGGIANSSSDLINIFYCVFQSCSVPGDGGGISNSNGEMRISACTFDGNHAGNDGGGIKIYSGTVYIQGCTFTNNTADVSGGGIQRGGGTVSIAISTLSGNTALQYGGGFDGATELIHCTVANNSASIAGGGGRATTTSMSNCIVYNNTALYGGAPDLFGEIESGGHNIIGDTSGCTGYAPTDMFVNPLLDTLADNGGLTKTIALLCGSPAIDAADSTTTFNDQRGTPIFGDTRDIGAFEFVCPSLTASLTGTTGACALTWTTYETQAGMTNYEWTFSGTAGVDYNISSGGGSGNNSVELRWRTNGNHTVAVTYTDPDYPCCTVTSGSVITYVVGATHLSITGPSTGCVNAAVTYTTSALAGASYLWSISGSASDYTIISGSSYDTSFTVQWHTSGSKHLDLHYTVSPGQGACIDFTTKTVTVNTNPTCAITGDEVICSGGSTVLNAGSHSGYLWSTTETTQTISVNAPGDYTATISDASGCTASAIVTLTQAQPLVATCSGTNVTCNGGSNGTAAVTETGGAPVTAQYLWSNGATTSGIDNLTAGTYTVTVTKGSSCITSESYTVTEPPQPLTPTISGNLAFCAGSSTTLNAGTFASYSWSSGATTQSISVNTGAPFSVTVTDANGCTGSTSVTTTVNPLPVINIGGSLSFCAGSSTTLDAGTFASYSWSTGATTQTIPVNTAATFTVTVTNANGCTKSASVSTTINQNPSCTISGSGTICAGASTQWCAPAGLLYNWSNGATTRCVTQSATGNYTVTTTDVKGCSSTCNKQLTVGSPLSVDAGPNKFIYYGYTDSSCTTLQSTIAGGTPPLTRQWSTAGTSNLGSGSSLSVCGLTASKTYYLTVTDANGCNMKDSVRVCVFDVRCGSGNKKVTICHGTGSANNPFQTLCILPADAKWHMLNHPGEKLGACGMVKSCGFNQRWSDEEMTEGVEEEMGLTVYPNPTGGEMNISFHSEVDGKYLLRLVDITGQILLTEMKDVSAGENKYTVNLQNFAPGIYLVLMQSGESILQTRIFKE